MSHQVQLTTCRCIPSSLSSLSFSFWPTVTLYSQHQQRKQQQQQVSIINNNNTCNHIHKQDTNSESFAVSHLINSCGLSTETAFHVSKYVKLNDQNADKPNRVLAFLRSHSFSDTQISKFLKSFPRVVLHDPDTTLLPKFQFFYSKGISKPQLARILSASPRIAARSLENYITPSFNFYENLFKSEKMAVDAFKRSHFVLYGYPQTEVPLRMDVFKKHGVPESNILWLLRKEPQYFFQNVDVLKKTLQKLRKMGFDPQSKKFMKAFCILNCLSKASWERKVAVYAKWGWTEETVLTAFRRFPYCMGVSEEKITAVMDHFANTLGWDSLVLAKRPHILCLSLERTIVPRTEVLQILQAKNLLKKNSGWTTPIDITEELFLQRFIYRFRTVAPELLKLYKTKKKLNSESQRAQGPLEGDHVVNPISFCLLCIVGVKLLWQAKSELQSLC